MTPKEKKTRKPGTVKLPLSAPFKLGDQEIKELTLRRPTPGDLRGLSVGQLLLADTDTYLEFLPRVLSPALTSDQVLEHLDIADFVSCMTEFGEYFQGK